MKEETIHIIQKKQSVWEVLLQENKTEFFVGKGKDSPELRSREIHLEQRHGEGLFDLEAIRKWLEKENSKNTRTEKQEQHLQNLTITKNSKEPLFVITGQQPSLLAGPMLCIYKGLTAIALAEKWQNILQRPVIPLFWIAGDDSDLEECGVVEWLDSDKNFAFRLEVEHPLEKIPMSLHSLKDGWEKFLKQKKGSWSKDVAEFIEANFTSQDTITSSAQKVLQYVLGPLGLLFVDGFSESFRKLAKSTMKKVVEEATDLESYLQTSSQKLVRQGYNPPVDIAKGTIHAFALEKVKPKNSNKNLIVRKRIQTKEATQRFIDTNSLTHNVLSRPLLIESVFPVLGHVLGPSELGYFLQLEKTFQKWFGHRPLLSPRMSATWVSQKQFTSLQEEGIDKEKIPTLTPSVFRRQFFEQRWIQVLEHQGWKRNVSSNLQGVLDFLMAAGKLPSNPKYTSLFETFKKRLDSQGDWLEGKIQKIALERYDPEYQDHKPALRWLAHGQGQDRHLNWFSLVNTVGETKAMQLLKEFNPLEEQHQLLVWEEA